jgi:hypothetical protein
VRTPPDPVEAFLAERRVATLTTLRPDGSPHLVAVRFADWAKHNVAAFR